jgi:hypothetical protein
MIGIVIVVLGAVIFVFGVAPALVPGGLPTGFLEFGGTNINPIESGGGALIAAIGAALVKFGQGRRLVLAAAVFAVAVLSLFSALSSQNSHFTLTEIDVTVQYGPNDEGYFGPSTQVLPVAMQPGRNLTVDEGSPFTLSFTLNESVLARGHDGIASIKATVPDFAFTVTSVDPSLPIRFSPGSSTRITVNIMAPYFDTGQACPPGSCNSEGYHGPIGLTLTTTG